MGAGLSIVQEWTPEAFAERVKHLGKSYEVYFDKVVENGINGEAILSIRSDEELQALFEEMGVTRLIHRKVILSMVQKVLVGDYSCRGVMARAEEVLVAPLLGNMNAQSRPVASAEDKPKLSSERELPASFLSLSLLPKPPTLERMPTFSIPDVETCVICFSEETRGIYCHSTSASERHFTCIECFAGYVHSICEDVGKFRDSEYAVCCPRVGTLGCQSKCWDISLVTAALLAKSAPAPTAADPSSCYDLEGKVVVDKLLMTLVSAANRATHPLAALAADGLSTSAAALAVADDPVTSATVLAIADALCLRCPLASCRVPLDPRPDGCMSMRCAACGTYFCFLCLTTHDSNDDCHAHVRTCKSNPNPGDYFTSPEKFDRAHRVLQIQAIRGVITRRVNPDAEGWRDDRSVLRVLDGARHLLKANNLSAENIFPTAALAFDGFFDGLTWEECLAGLREQLADPLVVKRGFAKTATFFREDPGVRSAWGRAGGCELMIEAMRTVEANAELCGEGLQAITWLIHENDRNKDRIVSENGCELVVACLERHSKESDRLSECAAFVLWNCCMNPTGRIRLTSPQMKNQLTPLLDDIVSRYPNNKHLQEYASRLRTSIHAAT